MAKRSAKPAPVMAPSPLPDDAPANTPVPSGQLQVTFTSVASGELVHRVHQNKHQADQFNPGINGNARFSPIQDDEGKPIPTLYGGTTMACALMEAVFHDVPHTAGSRASTKGNWLNGCIPPSG